MKFDKIYDVDNMYNFLVLSVENKLKERKKYYIEGVIDVDLYVV